MLCKAPAPLEQAEPPATTPNNPSPAPSARGQAGVGSRAEQALHLQMDPNWKEAYQVCYLAVDADAGKSISGIKFELLSPGYVPLLYGITLAR